MKSHDSHASQCTRSHAYLPMYAVHTGAADPVTLTVPCVGRCVAVSTGGSLTSYGCSDWRTAMKVSISSSSSWRSVSLPMSCVWEQSRGWRFQGQCHKELTLCKFTVQALGILHWLWGAVGLVALGAESPITVLLPFQSLRDTNQTRCVRWNLQAQSGGCFCFWMRFGCSVLQPDLAAQSWSESWLSSGRMRVGHPVAQWDSVVQW